MLGTETIKGWIIGIVIAIVGVIVIFQIVGGTGGSIMGAAGNASASGLPLASTFLGGNGIVLYIFIIAIVLALIIGFFGMIPGGKHHR